MLLFKSHCFISETFSLCKPKAESCKSLWLLCDCMLAIFCFFFALTPLSQQIGIKTSSIDIKKKKKKIRIIAQPIKIIRCG